MQLDGFLKTMVVNLGKFRSVIIQKSNQTSKPKQLLIGNDVVEVASSVKLLGIHLDDQLNLNLNISNICNLLPSNLMVLRD